MRDMLPLIVSVDDDADFQNYLLTLLQAKGYAVAGFETGEDFIANLKSGPLPALVLLDMILRDTDGLQIMEKIQAAGIRVPVIVISGVDMVRPVVEAMKLGAMDFLTKPFEERVFYAAIERALQASVRPLLPADTLPQGFVSNNARVLQLADIVKRAAHTDVPILILGESGVGKEVMARHAHTHSGRSGKPFVKVNCAAVPQELLESELFGHEKGAFTGALTDKPGKFEQAHTGTLLLDEIGEMSPQLQTKLLHVLQDGCFTRLGATKQIRVDARIIATTNIKINEAIATGKFREDLYFRLNVISLELPPLRERPEDIPELCDFFMAKYRDRYNLENRELPADLLRHFAQYDWPGNIRQLENSIKEFLVLPDHHSLFSELNVSERAVEDSDTGAADNSGQPYSLLDVGALAADGAERELVDRILKETGGNRKKAARMMNISYKSLLNKIKRWSQPTPPKAHLITDEVVTDTRDAA
jgi:two-component system, NtrC family, response regulator AtoC